MAKVISDILLRGTRLHNSPGDLHPRPAGGAAASVTAFTEQGSPRMTWVVNHG